MVIETKDNTPPVIGLVQFFRLHPWTPKTFAVLGLSAAVIASGRFMGTPWPRFVSSITLIAGMFALFILWSIFMNWVRLRTKMPKILMQVIGVMPIIILLVRSALLEKESWSSFLPALGTVLLIIAMFGLWRVLASRIGRVMTSGLYGLLFGTPLLVYSLMRDEPIPGLISLAAGFVLGIIGYGLVAAYDRTKRSKYSPLFIPLWIVCLCILPVVIVVIISIVLEWK